VRFTCLFADSSRNCCARLQRQLQAVGRDGPSSRCQWRYPHAMESGDFDAVLATSCRGRRWRPYLFWHSKDRSNTVTTQCAVDARRHRRMRDDQAYSRA